MGKVRIWADGDLERLIEKCFVNDISLVEILDKYELNDYQIALLKERYRGYNKKREILRKNGVVVDKLPDNFVVVPDSILRVRSNDRKKQNDNLVVISDLRRQISGCENEKERFHLQLKYDKLVSEFITKNMFFVEYGARVLHSEYPLPLDELVQYCLEGLAQALNNYDVTSEASFTSYLFIVMKNNVNRHFKELTGVSLWSYEARLGVRKDNSLVRSIESLEDYEDEASLKDDTDVSCDRADLELALKSLDDRARKVLELRFLKELKLRECTGTVNLSRTGIRDVEKKALEKCGKVLGQCDIMSEDEGKKELKYRILELLSIGIVGIEDFVKMDGYDVEVFDVYTILMKILNICNGTDKLKERLGETFTKISDDEIIKSLRKHCHLDNLEDEFILLVVKNYEELLVNVVNALGSDNEKKLKL